MLSQRRQTSMLPLRVRSLRESFKTCRFTRRRSDSCVLIAPRTVRTAMYF